ncbi:hypothetical protein GGR52DRAFT_568168 [Hypoxylon sp. FL1284]|nr:hypothetical protein GGR52DRAFT_568168 [Hypoxylon sp. FL1284]
MSAGSKEELLRLLTAYDNSHEPRPAFNNKSTVYGLVVPFMVISYTCVILRLYYRIKLRCLGWDDLFVVLFRVSATIGSISLCLALNNGFGEHILTIGLDNIVEFQKKFYVCLATYTISTTLTKLCLLSQYLRIFEAGTRTRLVCWAGLVISALWGIAFSFLALFPCFPMSGFWNWTKPARCYGFGSRVPAETAGTFAGHTGSNVVLDAMVLAIVVPLYFRKTTALKQRMGIGFLLLLGVVVNLISILCLKSIIEHKAGTYPVLDPTWYGPKSITLAALEVDLASICASVPTFWPILSQRLMGMGAVFVTREVHVTHQHRRLSDDDDGESKRATASSYELKPVHVVDDVTVAPSPSTKTSSLSSLTAAAASQRYYHKSDEFASSGEVGGVVLTPNEAVSESQVQSDGQRGFEREQERLRLALVESRGSGRKNGMKAG